MFALKYIYSIHKSKCFTFKREASCDVSCLEHLEFDQSETSRGDYWFPSCLKKASHFKPGRKIFGKQDGVKGQLIVPTGAFTCSLEIKVFLRKI